MLPYGALLDFCLLCRFGADSCVAMPSTLVPVGTLLLVHVNTVLLQVRHAAFFTLYGACTTTLTWVDGACLCCIPALHCLTCAILPVPFPVPVPPMNSWHYLTIGVSYLLCCCNSLPVSSYGLLDSVSMGAGTLCNYTYLLPVCGTWAGVPTCLPAILEHGVSLPSPCLLTIYLF
jgi:hypothetical protein